jgi:hypothetical protein
MTLWDRTAWALMMAAVVIGANGLNEARQHEFATAAFCGVIALGLVGLWRLLRWYEERR